MVVVFVRNRVFLALEIILSVWYMLSGLSSLLFILYLSNLVSHSILSQIFLHNIYLLNIKNSFWFLNSTRAVANVTQIPRLMTGAYLMIRNTCRIEFKQTFCLALISIIYFTDKLFIRLKIIHLTDWLLSYFFVLIPYCTKFFNNHESFWVTSMYKSICKSVLAYVYYVQVQD